MRAFFSVDLPDELAAPLDRLQGELAGADGLAFVDPSQAHVTLKFLGEVADSEVDDVVAAGERAVEAADVEPFDCRVSTLGVFPSLEYISVVWAGVEDGEDGKGGDEGKGNDDGTSPLTDLHEALETETTALGHAPEDNEFTPHVTLARMSDARGKELVQDAVRNHTPEVGTFTVEEIRLTESTLTPEGPVYETVETFEL